MKKVLISLIITLLSSTACAKKATVIETWFSVDDYSIQIDSDDQGTEISVTPSLWVNPADSTFKSNLGLILHYPSADERLDVGLISIFSSNKPKVDLPDIQVQTSYMFLLRKPDEDDLENPLEKEDNWKDIGTYALNPG